MKINPFDKKIEEYDKWFEHNIHTFHSELEAIKLCFEEGKKTIEIGVGTGIFAEKLGVKEGVEPSALMAAVSRLRGIHIISSYAEDLDLEDNSYEQILMITVLCFLSDEQKAIAEIKRILKKNGIFILAFLNKNTKLGRIYDEKKENDDIYKYARFKSDEEVIQLLESNHFKIIDSYNTVTDFENKIYDINKGIGDGIFTVIKAIKEKK